MCRTLNQRKKNLEIISIESVSENSWEEYGNGHKNRCPRAEGSKGKEGAESTLKCHHWVHPAWEQVGLTTGVWRLCFASLLLCCNAEMSFERIMVTMATLVVSLGGSWTDWYFILFFHPRKHWPLKAKSHWWKNSFSTTLETQSPFVTVSKISWVSLEPLPLSVQHS